MWLSPPKNSAQADLERALNEASQREADEVALRRVWSRLAQVPNLVPVQSEVRVQRRTRWLFVGMASLAGAAAAVTFMWLGGPSTGGARSTSKPVAAAVDGRSAKHDDTRSTLVAPATVRTGSGETLHLALRGGTEVTVTSDSTLVLDEDEQPTVSTGEVRFHVPTQPRGHTFSVRASKYRVVVVGTRFRVRVNGGNVAVGVEEGVVEVWNDTARLQRIEAGDSWVSPPTEHALLKPTGLPELAATRRLETDAKARAGVATSLRGARPMRGLRASTSPSASVLSPLSPVSARPGEKNFSAPQSMTTEKAAAGVESATGGAALASPAPGADTALVAQARAARLAGEPKKALDLYLVLVKRGGTVGENAEYEVGRVLRDGLHQPYDAIATWRAYRSAHPRGLLRIESDISIIETLIAVDDKPAALTEALEFLRRFSDSERRCEIGALAGDLKRERGDFRSAIVEYDAALGYGRCRREMVDAISFHRAVSMLSDDREDGVKSLRTYLDSNPKGRFRSQAERLMADHQRALAARRF